MALLWRHEAPAATRHGRPGPKPGLSVDSVVAAAIAAADVRGLYGAHPWAAHVAAGRPPLGPGLIRCYEIELSAVAGTGLGDLELDLAVSSVTGLVRALGAASAARDELARLTGISEAQWWQASEPYLTSVFDPDRFPLAARVGAASGQELQAAEDPDRTLDFALTALLDGLEARIDAAR